MRIHTDNEVFRGALWRLDDIANATLAYVPYALSIVCFMDAGDTAHVELEHSNLGSSWFINGASDHRSFFQGGLLH
jgi:hypothetical protein